MRARAEAPEAGGLRSEGPEHSASRSRRLTVNSRGSPAGTLGSREKRNTPPGAGNCACALLPSVRRTAADKLPEQATS